MGRERQGVTYSTTCCQETSTVWFPASRFLTVFLHLFSFAFILIPRSLFPTVREWLDNGPADVRGRGERERERKLVPFHYNYHQYNNYNLTSRPPFNTDITRMIRIDIGRPLARSNILFRKTLYILNAIVLCTSDWKQSCEIVLMS